MALINATLGYDDIKDADLVIEAVFEDMGVKETGVQEARRGDEARRDPGVATPRRWTSNKIAAFTKRPQDVIGLHFFSPANVMKLLEVVRGEKTAQGRAGHRDGAGQEDQEDRLWCPACATASSATA